MLVIAGAQYLVGDEVLVPHYTGDYCTVDCNRFVTEEGLEDLGYSEEFVADAKENAIEHEGVSYYPAEYSPYNIDGDWELISDLSEVRL